MLEARTVRQRIESLRLSQSGGVGGQYSRRSGSLLDHACTGSCIYMFIESVVNYSPLAGDLQLTGVKVLFRFMCGSAHDCRHMVHGSGARAEYYY